MTVARLRKRKNGKRTIEIDRKRGIGDTPLTPELKSDEGSQGNANMRLALIDARPLTRVSVSDLLRTDAKEFSVCSFASAGELINAATADDLELGLIVLNIGSRALAEELRQDIQRLKRAFADTPIVVLSDHKDASSLSIMETLRAGARGFVLTSYNPAVVIQALRLVRSGGMFVPADVLLAELESPPRRAAGRRESDVVLACCGAFTPRQAEVLQLLQCGKSNKVIASELEMQESTVKVHLRHIMKKLDVTNRTHAALLAYQMSHGAGGDSRPESKVWKVEAHAQRESHGVVGRVVGQAEGRREIQ